MFNTVASQDKSLKYTSFVHYTLKIIKRNMIFENICNQINFIHGSLNCIPKSVHFQYVKEKQKNIFMIFFLESEQIVGY